MPRNYRINFVPGRRLVLSRLIACIFAISLIAQLTGAFYHLNTTNAMGGGACNMEIIKTASPAQVMPGDEIDYVVTVKNTGTANCTGGGVEVQEFYDALVSFISSNPVPSIGNDNWNFGTVFPGGTHVITIKVKVSENAQDSDMITNKACVWAFEQGEKGVPGNPTSWKCAAVTTKVQTGGPPPPPPPSPCPAGNCPTGGRTIYPKITIDKSVSKAIVVPGETITYTLTIHAGGDDDSVLVAVTDTLPQGLRYADGANSPRTWDLGNMPFGTSKTLTYDVKVSETAQPGTYENIAVVTIANGIPPDNRDEARAKVEIPSLPQGDRIPKLSIEKAVSQRIISPDSALTYSVIVKNIGTAAARNVRVDDVLPNGFTFAPDGTSVKVFPLGDIPAGETRDLSYTVRVASEARAGVYPNFATARADNAAHDSASVDVEVRAAKVLGFDELPDTGIEEGIAGQAGALAGIFILIGGMMLRRKRNGLE